MEFIVNSKPIGAHVPRALHPNVGKKCQYVKPVHTVHDNERDILRKYCANPLPNMRFLKVMVEETFTVTEAINSRDRGVFVNVPHKSSHMVALITIHNGYAYIQDVTTNGHLVNYRPIPCHGSIARKDIMRTIGIYDSSSTRVWAQKVKRVS